MISNSKKVAALLNPLKMSEPVPTDADFDGGIYIGKTLLYRLPFFLNTNRLVNPHISIVGMTGSGKTYLLKSIIVRFCRNNKFDLFLLDWTSEYSDVMRYIGGKIVTLKSAGDLPEISSLITGITCIDISKIEDESEKRATASMVLNGLCEFMVSLPPEGNAKKVIVIDEAWKLVDFDKLLGRLFREGRKFGFSVVVATQLVKDVNNEILANTACSFIFRLMGSENFESLVSSGLVLMENVDFIKSLGRGECMISVTERDSGMQFSFAIERVNGFDFSNYTIGGELINSKVSKERINAAMEKLQINNDGRIRVLRLFESGSGNVDVSSLVSTLSSIGLNRAGIILFLKSIGVDEAFASLTIESLKGVHFVD
ncbi:DUF87 domain-containing protein [Candidatus Marsarchaeota archaeon]|nr:DUF87 domain-containing protein [Candidatus Marsarchaeota archaeon]